MPNLHQKRGFARRDRDSYDTPPEAIAPLAALLQSPEPWVEPCAGCGNLVAAIPNCVDSSDIAPRAPSIRQADAFDEHPILPVITNPPFNLADQLLTHWLATAPHVWLLHPLGKIANRNWQWAMAHATDILPIGRVRWIAGTANGGYVDHVWVRYGGVKSDGILRFHRRR
jgi:hypothetical protein